jgi:2-hydroxychromene-2-carboxylate isomerase
MPATFYFDLASPYSYLAAERVDGLFADAGLEPPRWQPILFGALVKELGRTPWGLTDGKEEHFAEIERRAAAYGLPPLAWPDPLPPNSLHAMRAATVAAGVGPQVTERIAAPETKAKLRAATEEAWAAGLQGVLTVAVAEQLFWGDDRLAEAVAAAVA